MTGMVTAPSPMPRTTNVATSHHSAAPTVTRAKGHRGERHDHQPGEGHPARADPVRQLARDAPTGQHADALRGDQQAGGKGLLTTYLLEVQRDQQHRAVEREAGQE